MGSSHSAIAVANTVLEIANEERRKLTPMEIQKHTFFAHGWFLGYTSEPLIGDAVEAWRYGPVIPALYHAFKSFKERSIDAFALELDIKRQEIWAPKVEDKDLRTFVKKVWDAYKSYDALELSAITHETGSPWDETYHHRGGAARRGAVIDNALVAAYYRAKIAPKVAEV